VVSLIPVQGLPLIEKDDELAELIVHALRQQGDALRAGDILVLTQKIVSKAEGRIVQLESVEPSPEALELARKADKDPRLVELVLQESREIVRVRPGLIVVEDRRGFICTNAGIDRSNVVQGERGEWVALLPLDPDASARTIRRRVAELEGVEVAVLIIDSHARAFREGTVGVAIGLAGMPALSDRRGDTDLTGYTLQHTVIGLADELAAAASVVMGPAAEGVPAVVVRGVDLPSGDGSARELQRPRELDLFR
jgi:coenzyme F420-0:L-glutamate ligase/coenzyme F420-1:gamma-L-glutamate ligase